MTSVAKPRQDYPTKEDEYSFADWLNDQMQEKKLSIKEVSEKSGITYVGIWNIVNGYTWSPRSETRRKIAKAINVAVPKDVEAVSEAEATLMSDFKWAPYDPYELDKIPARPGVYVIYDITDRPVYVGQSGKSVRSRIKDHYSRFWYKDPLVKRLSVVELSDPKLCRQIENILISFLGTHAVLNKLGVNRDPLESFEGE
jgi:transcriptional regulator with XRE-family HTH domain